MILGSPFYDIARLFAIIAIASLCKPSAQPSYFWAVAGVDVLGVAPAGIVSWRRLEVCGGALAQGPLKGSVQ